MGRRGRSTTIGKFAKIHLDRRVSEMRILAEVLRQEGVPVVDTAGGHCERDPHDLAA